MQLQILIFDYNVPRTYHEDQHKFTSDRNIHAAFVGKILKLWVKDMQYGKNLNNDVFAEYCMQFS